ncbi:FlgT C-terminal domain-containing protein [Halomonas litopenaei]|uniref:FlgT C-terminal domain-containing protein n=1 Tax=Halomonas litopenaei TaxID=2109328 RepID=UPI003FA0931A
MSNAEKATATVVKVIDSFTVVINRGSVHGVREGDKYLIYHLDDEEIIDPDSGESLGKLEVLRGAGVVTYVQEKMATVASSRKEAGKRVIKKSTSPFAALGAINAIASKTMGGDEIVEEEPPESIPYEYPQYGDKAKLTS